MNMLLYEVGSWHVCNRLSEDLADAVLNNTSHDLPSNASNARVPA